MESPKNIIFHLRLSAFICGYKKTYYWCHKSGWI